MEIQQDIESKADIVRHLKSKIEFCHLLIEKMELEPAIMRSTRQICLLHEHPFVKQLMEKAKKGDTISREEMRHAAFLTILFFPYIHNFHRNSHLLFKRRKFMIFSLLVLGFYGQNAAALLNMDRQNVQRIYDELTKVWGLKNAHALKRLVALLTDVAM